MIYAILMAVAFVGAVCLATILIVTRKKGGDDFQSSRQEALSPVKPVRRENEEKSDRRDLITRAQRPDRDDFGLTESNPICTASPAATEKYLSLLRSNSGEALHWLREGTVFVQNLHGVGSVSEEVYLVYLRGRPYKRLYFCPSGKNTALVPKDLQLSQEGDAAPYRGSIALEAKEKNLTVEQVLKKQALIYQTQSQRAARDSSSGPRTAPAEKAARQEAPAERPRSAQASAKPQSVPAPAVSAPSKKEAVAVEPKEPGDTGVPSSATFPNYLPGFEPDNIKPSLEKFLSVMDNVYPDGVVKGSTWDHEHWDRAAAMLCRYLGYANGTDFLEAYGYKVEK